MFPVCVSVILHCNFKVTNRLFSNEISNKLFVYIAFVNGINWIIFCFDKQQQIVDNYLYEYSIN